MIRRSQAFAAMRQIIIDDLMMKVSEYVERFNAEVEDIRRQRDEMAKDPKHGEAKADHIKRARIQDIVTKRKAFLDSLNTEMHARMEEKVSEYGGEIIEEVEEGTDKVLALKANFPDDTTARMPKSLWVDYKQFQRV